VQDNPWLQDPYLPSASVSTVEQIDELQQLYDEAPCGYHSLNAHGVFVRVNQTELTMLGYRPLLASRYLPIIFLCLSKEDMLEI
jgi:hypothetical protein